MGDTNNFKLRFSETFDNSDITNLIFKKYIPFYFSFVLVSVSKSWNFWFTQIQMDFMSPFLKINKKALRYLNKRPHFVPLKSAEELFSQFKREQYYKLFNWGLREGCFPFLQKIVHPFDAYEICNSNPTYFANFLRDNNLSHYRTRDLSAPNISLTANIVTKKPCIQTLSFFFKNLIDNIQNSHQEPTILNQESFNHLIYKLIEYSCINVNTEALHLSLITLTKYYELQKIKLTIPDDRLSDLSYTICNYYNSSIMEILLSFFKKYGITFDPIREFFDEYIMTYEHSMQLYDPLSMNDNINVIQHMIELNLILYEKYTLLEYPYPSFDYTFSWWLIKQLEVTLQFSSNEKFNFIIKFLEEKKIDKKEICDGLNKWFGVLVNIEKPCIDLFKITILKEKFGFNRLIPEDYIWNFFLAISTLDDYWLNEKTKNALKQYNVPDHILLEIIYNQTLQRSCINQSVHVSNLLEKELGTKNLKYWCWLIEYCNYTNYHVLFVKLRDLMVLPYLETSIKFLLNKCLLT